MTGTFRTLEIQGQVCFMIPYGELCRLIDEAGVAPGLGPAGQGYHMEQRPAELARFLCACFELGVQSMLELGTGEYGGLTRFCTGTLRWDVTVIDICAPRYRSGRLILGKTSDDQVYKQVEGRRFDLVLIDADHSYGGVAHDHRLYAPLATKIVAFHDIAPGREECRGVATFWNEIAYSSGSGREAPARGGLKGGHHEIIDPDHPVGIGWYSV